MIIGKEIIMINRQNHLVAHPYSYVAVAKLWGLTVRLVKSKANAHRLFPVPDGYGFINFVEDFQYLVSCVSKNGKLDKEVSKCLAKTARAFDCLYSSYLLIKACPLTLRDMFTLLLLCSLCCIGEEFRISQLFYPMYFWCVASHAVEGVYNF